MAREMDLALRTMIRIIKQDLGLGAFKRQRRQHLAVALKENRKKKSKLANWCQGSNEVMILPQFSGKASLLYIIVKRTLKQ